MTGGSAARAEGANWSPAWTAVVLTVMTRLTGTLCGSFHYDDFHHVVENPHIRDIHQIGVHFVDPATWTGSAQGLMYRPVVMAVHTIDHAIWGDVPVGWLLTNLLIHAAVAACVARLACSVGLTARAATLAGIVMAVHPVVTETVCYISSRSESLAALLVLGTLILHVRGHHRRRRVAWLAAAAECVAAAGAALAKETAFLLPVAVFGVDLCLRPGAPPDRLVRALRGAVPSAAGLLVVLAVRQHLLGAATTEAAWNSVSPGADPYSGAGRSILENWLTQLHVVPCYVGTLLLPAGLSVEYDIPVVRRAGAYELVAACVLAGLLAWCLARCVRRGGLVALLPLWFVCFLAPSVAAPLNIVMNDHRMYLPCIAFSIAAGVVLDRVMEARGAAWIRNCTRGAVVLVIASMMAGSILRSLEWRSEVSVWAAAVRRVPRSARARHSLANALYLESLATGEHESRVALLKDALAEAAEAGRIRPGWYELDLTTGRILLEAGRTDEDAQMFAAALRHFERAEGLAPAEPEHALALQVFCLGISGDHTRAAERRRRLASMSEFGARLARGLVVEPASSAHHSLAPSSKQSE